eukprot:SAG31_NODE_35472_length_322_cov_2.076233_1_plen_74_part_10
MALAMADPTAKQQSVPVLAAAAAAVLSLLVGYLLGNYDGFHAAVAAPRANSSSSSSSNNLPPLNSWGRPLVSDE